MPNDDVILSEGKGSDRMLPQNIPDDDELLSEERNIFERILPECQIPHLEICLFENTRYILLLNKRIYKMSILLGLTANMMNPLNSVFNTGARPKLTEKASSSQVRSELYSQKTDHLCRTPPTRTLESREYILTRLN